MLATTVLSTNMLLPAPVFSKMPAAARLWITLFSAISDLPARNVMPIWPAPFPSISSPLRWITSVAVALTMIPVPPDATPIPANPSPWMAM